MPKVPTYDSPVVEQQATPDVRQNPNVAPTGMQRLGQGMEQAASAMGAAFEKVRTREDTISRAREFSKYYNDVFSEYNRIQDEEDLTDPSVGRSFNEKINSLTNQYIQSHGGSEDSRARLITRLEDTRARFANEMTSRVMQAQKDFLDGQIGDQISRISSKILEEPTSENIRDAFSKIDSLMGEFAPALDPEQETRHRSAAQSAVITNALSSLVTAGNYEDAMDMIDENPAIQSMLSPDENRRISLAIQDGMRQQEKQINEFNNKLKAAEMAKGSPLTQAERMELFGLDSKSYEMQTDAGKALMDRKFFENKFGPNSPEIEYFDKINSTARSSLKLEGEMGNLLEVESQLQADGVPENDFRMQSVREQMKALNPKYMEAREKRVSFKKDRLNLSMLEDKVSVVKSSTYAALSKIFQQNVKSKEDIERVIKENPSLLTTGYIGSKLKEYPGTDAAELEGYLDNIRSNEVLRHLVDIKNASPTGGAFGNMSDQEGKRLERVLGTLDVGKPENLVSSLVRLLDSYDEAFVNLSSAFKEDYEGYDFYKPSPSENETPESGASAVKSIGADGSPEQIIKEQDQSSDSKDNEKLEIKNMDIDDLVGLDIDSLSDEDIQIALDRWNELNESKDK